MTTDFIDQAIDSLKANGLYRRLRSIQGAQGPWVEMEGRRVLNLCSNNYLGLAAHPRVREAAARAAANWGCGSGASRLICGNMSFHEQLEEKLARFKGTEAALLYGNGYAANVGIISALAGRGDYVFSDSLNHASIVDGCRLSKAQIVVFDHKDTASLETALRAARSDGADSSRRLIAVDAIFSMDGDLAPLPQLAALAEKYGAMLMVDEAHATGAVGPGGKGAVASFGLTQQVPVVMGTLGKALGSYGAFVAGSRKLVDFLINTSRSFIFSTAPPPTVVAAASASLDVLESAPSLVEDLQRNAAYMRRGLRSLGYDTLDSETHIIPVIAGDAAAAVEASELLLAEGVLAVAIRPPTVPPGKSRIRVTVMANHTKEDLEFALGAFEKVRPVVQKATARMRAGAAKSSQCSGESENPPVPLE
ncbi:MAG: 8-amino-7-oxononanoate synthase [Chloroflexi bacterium]|nr:8-amino-7-oxononanoate synthase [Chloroflexota bacterium]